MFLFAERPEPGADLNAGLSLSALADTPLHPPPLPQVAKAYYLERRSGYVFLGELYAHVVLAEFRGRVLHRTRPVAVVFARHLRLGRPFDGQPQAAGAGS